jgi:phage terminase large subunit-like protein
MSPIPYMAGWFHTELCELFDQFLLACINKLSPRILLSVPPGHGKALAFRTQVGTVSGMKPVETLVPGDLVIGSDGRPTRVVAVRKWANRPCFRVTADDGASVVVDAEHEWVVGLERKRPEVMQTRTTSWLYRRQQSLSEPRKPRIRLVRIEGAHDPALPIPPYSLGAWLGDGARSAGTVSGLAEKQAHVRVRMEREGYTVPLHEDERGWGVHGLLVQLRAANLLNNKHIPEQYFHSSVAQRMALLQALIDTDGYIDPKGQIEFCSMTQALAEGVRRLVHTLGVKASLNTGRATIDGVDYGEKYRVLFMLKDAASMPRKAALCRNGVRTTGRYLSFEPAPTQDTCCIQVEAEDYLYFVGEGYLLTHNSMLASQYFPAFGMGRYPHLEYIGATYGQDLSNTFGRRVRNTLNDPRFAELFPALTLSTQANAQDCIETTAAGRYIATSVGGAVTGMRGHVLAIDDPTKGREESQSETQMEKNFEWYMADARTRLYPGGGIIAIATRWTEADLLGRLIELEKNGGEKWTKVIYPAIATHDERHRKKGEALHPERYSREELLRIRDNLYAAGKQRDWTSLYQCSPTMEDGDFFKREHLRIRPVTDYPPPSSLSMYIACDLAVSTDDARDPSCIWPVGVDADRQLWYHPDFFHGRIDILTSCRLLLTKAKDHKAMAILIEKGPITRCAVPILTEMMRKMGRFFQIIEVSCLSKDKNKRVKAGPLQGAFAQGRAFLPNIPFVHESTVPELLAFDGGKHDDQVDCLALPAYILPELLSGREALPELRSTRDRAYLSDAPAKRINKHAPPPFLRDRSRPA